MRKFILMVIAMLLSMSAAAENIVSKEDADYIFTLSKSQWKSYASKLYMPGWDVRLIESKDGGVTFAAMNPSTNIGMSIQPIYEDSENDIFVLTVLSLYPKGTLQDTSDEWLKNIEAGAQEDLGSRYELKASYNVEQYDYETVSLDIFKLK